MNFAQTRRSLVCPESSSPAARRRILLLFTTFLVLLACLIPPASSQVLFPHDYGNGQVLTFSGGSPGGNYELKVLSPSGNVVLASQAFLDVTFLNHRQVKVSARNVTIEAYRRFYTVIGPRGATQMLAAVYAAGTDEIVDGTLHVVTLYDPSPQFENDTFAGNQRWTTTAQVLEGRTTTLSFDWKAFDAGTKNWYVGNRVYNPPIRCQIGTGNAAVLPNAQTDSHLATLVPGGTNTAGTSGKVSIEFAAPPYDPGGRNDYTVRVHNWQDPYWIGGEGSPSGCNGSALDVRITVKPVNTAPGFVDGTPQNRDLPGLLNSHGVVLDVGRPVAATDREDGHLTYSIENVYKSNGPHTTPPYQGNCTETTCTDGVFDINASSGQIRTKANKSYTRQPYFVVVTVTDSEGLSDRTYVWINDGPVPYQPWDLMVFPGETTILLSWFRPERCPYSGPIIGYRIEWSATGNSDWQVLVENTGNLFTEYCDTGLTAGETRYYRVRAINAIGYGNPSNVDGATVGAGVRSQQASGSALSVADAQVTEAAGAAVSFTVSLEPASPSTIRVDYGTVDATATAGLDYAQTAGTLTFKAGETSKTVAVAVLDDAIDEGEETFALILYNPQGGAYLEDPEATGTIRNTDPMPRAWLARFGRTPAAHVLGALEQRLQEEAANPYVQLGGYHVGDYQDSGLAARLSASHSLSESLSESVTPGPGMTERQLFLGSSFHLVSDGGESPSDPSVSAWGRVASSSLQSSQNELSLDGAVTTATLGVDGTWQRWLVGIALAYSKGEGSYALAELDSGRMDSTLTTIHPYVSYAPSHRVRLWGMVGYGSGSLRLIGSQSISTDLDLAMGALGIRGELLDPLTSISGLGLAIRSDALWTRTSSSPVEGRLTAAQASTTRLRLVLEVSRPLTLAEGGTLTPVVEVALRHDGGDAERGSGLEVGGRLGYSTAWGLTAEISIHALLVHEASDYQEWGAGGTIRFDSGRKGLGLIASLEPTWGSAASGTERLWNQPDARSLAEGGAWPQAVGSV
ncbi:MAG: fibronectin type III domain-containing protein, partial [Candidatus Tectomicrobia bacterium]|nr:fibronectin type III domain-containing protein [Candidatus Tectomicrobia bacterium]